MTDPRGDLPDSEELQAQEVARGDLPDSEELQAQEVAVFQKRESVQYTIPSFPALTVLLQEVKLQWINNLDEVISFDRYMRKCSLLNQPLPALALIPIGYRNAFFVQV